MGIEILNKFKAISAQIAESQGKNKQVLWEQGEALLKEFQNKKYIRKIPIESFSIDYYSLIPIIDYYLCENYVEDNIPSPIENKQNSNWMCESSFCFLNVRACGNHQETAGDLINVTKLLLSIRADSIHLAPFFSCDLSIIYNINTHESIDETIINRDFLDNGMSGVEQLQFLIDFTHLIGKTIGFDLEPHTSQFSKVAIQNPSLFRWIQLEKKNEGLVDNLTQEEQLESSFQQKIYEQVEKIREDVLEGYGLKQLENTSIDKTEKEINSNQERCIKNAHKKIVDELIDSNLWTIPSHTWGGIGLPRFSYWNKHERYPEFEYIRIEKGKEIDHKDHAFGVLTPFRFYDGLSMNKKPRDDSRISLNKEVLEYYFNIVVRVRYKYSFDFVRFDFVDHVFDSVFKSGIDGHEMPISDRLTPEVLSCVIQKIRSKCGANIGAIAERMGTDIGDYASCGFDLVLGDDFLSDVSVDRLKKTIKKGITLGKTNADRESRASICYTIDTHDRENSLFELPPILSKGIYSIALRHFASRFGSAGFGQRPKYEIIGNQDGTEGLYSAIRYGRPLQWKSNRELNQIHHNIEDVYDEMRKYIRLAKVKNIKPDLDYIVCWQLVAKEYTIIAVSNTSPYRSFCDIAVYPDIKFSQATRIDPYFSGREEVDDLNVNSLLPMRSMLFLLKTSNS